MRSQQEINTIARECKINPIYARVLFDSLKNRQDYLKMAKRAVEKKPKPFVKWVGGKRQLLQQFRDLGLYPPDDFDPITSTYFEPFVGGGAVFFDLLPKKAELSDLNSELVITYNIIKNNVDGLVRSLKKHKYEKEYYLMVRAKDPKRLPDLDVASRFIFLNRTCFNGMYRVNSKGGFNVPFGKYTNPIICDEENLRKVSKALQNVTIKNQDYKAVLKSAKKGDFVYFDPPYHPMSETSSFTSYTTQGFGRDNQIELRDTFLDLHRRGCFVMLSNSNAPFINEIYGEIITYGVTLHKILASRAINAKGSGRGKIKEVLVVNY